MKIRNRIFMLLAGTVVLMLALRFQGSQLITPSAPYGIVSLELSHDANQTAMITSEWAVIRNAFSINMLLDFIFIFFYGLFMYANCWYIAVLIPSWKQVATLLAIGSLIAMGLDILENGLMIISVTMFTHQAISFLTRNFAILKFSLVAAVFVFIIIAWLFYWIKKSRTPNAEIVTVK